MDYSKSIGIFLGVIGMAYKDRGNTETPDFSDENFTKDGNAHELDLSAIVPEAGANHLVRINVELHDANAHADAIMFGKVGYSSAPMAYSSVSEPVAGASIRASDMWIMMDSARKIQYIAQESVSVHFLYVRGWLED